MILKMAIEMLCKRNLLIHSNLQNCPSTLEGPCSPCAVKTFGHKPFRLLRLAAGEKVYDRKDEHGPLEHVKAICINRLRSILIAVLG